MQECIALIFAGGTGRRMNSKGKPKQFLELNGKPIIVHTIEKFEKHSSVTGILVVCHKEWIGYLEELLITFNIHKVKAVVPGGDTGQISIKNGLIKISSLYDDLKHIVVLIHDGVRPLIDEETISHNIDAVLKYGSAITVSPASETIVEADKDNQILRIYERDKCQLARAPQSFILADILNAHQKIDVSIAPEIIDSATLMKQCGYSLHMVEGPVENIKITTPADFYIFRAITQAKENSQIWGL